MPSRILLCFLLTVTPAFGASEERVSLLLNLIRDSGCQMTGQEAASVLPKHGFSKQEAREIEAILIERGAIDTGKLGVIALTRKACKG